MSDLDPPKKRMKSKLKGKNRGTRNQTSIISQPDPIHPAFLSQADRDEVARLRKILLELGRESGQPKKKSNRIYRLTFAPVAWQKLQYMCHKGGTEIGGLAICADEDRPTFITDFGLLKQYCTPAYNEFDRKSLGDYYVDMARLGCHPFQFNRIWIHTHPARSAEPSGVDEATFSKEYAESSWAVMFILSRENYTYARFKINTDVKASSRIDAVVDYAGCPKYLENAELRASLYASWEKEFNAHIRPMSELPDEAKETGASSKTKRFPIQTTGSSHRGVGPDGDDHDWIPSYAGAPVHISSASTIEVANHLPPSKVEGDRTIDAYYLHVHKLTVDAEAGKVEAIEEIRLIKALGNPLDVEKEAIAVLDRIVADSIASAGDSAVEGAPSAPEPSFDDNYYDQLVRTAERGDAHAAEELMGMNRRMDSARGLAGI